MPRLHIDLLGPWRITLDGQTVLEQAPAKLLALIAYLILGKTKRFERRVLAALLWPEVTESMAMNNLRQLLFSARRSDAGVFDLLLTVTPSDLSFTGNDAVAV